MPSQSNYMSDICIMIPYCGNLQSNGIMKLIENNPVAQYLIDELTYFSDYECSNIITRNIERMYLGEFYFACMDDDYKSIQASESALLFLSHHSSMNLAVLTIYIGKNSFSTSLIGDHVSADELYISADRKINKDDYIHVDNFISSELGLERCGESKCIMFLSKRPSDEKELCCMLAGEAYDGVHFQHILDSENIRNILAHSFSQYNYYESYASKKSVIFIYDSFSENMKDNIDVEMSAMYIVELIMFQITAIRRTSNRIVDLLSDNQKTTYREIERLYSEFGSTVRLWETSNYKYIPAQNFADGIYKAFGTEQLLNEYVRYQSHLERIVEIKTTRTNDRHSSALNFLLTILACIQVIPLFIDFYSYSLRNSKMDIFIVSTASLIAVTIFIMISIVTHKKRHN